MLLEPTTHLQLHTYIAPLPKSKKWRPPAKYWVKGKVLETHCRAALIKQVSLVHILLPVELKEVETPSKVLGEGPGVGDT